MEQTFVTSAFAQKYQSHSINWCNTISEFKVLCADPSDHIREVYNSAVVEDSPSAHVTQGLVTTVTKGVSKSDVTNVHLNFLYAALAICTGLTASPLMKHYTKGMVTDGSLAWDRGKFPEAIHAVFDVSDSNC